MIHPIRRSALIAMVAALVCVACGPVGQQAGHSGPDTSSADHGGSVDHSAAGTTTGPAPDTASAGPPSSAAANSSAASSSTPTNVYAAAGAGMLSPVARQATPLVYVPSTRDNTVSVIDPATFTVIRTIAVGALPQHVVPSWDMKTLWVNSNQGNTLTPIDPVTGTAGAPVPVEDPYNLYFTPDGAHALVMAERLNRIDVLDATTMALQRSLPVPCAGVNHADFSADLSFFVASCEFSGKLLVIDAAASAVQQVIDLNPVATPGATDPMAAMAAGGPAMSLEPGASSMPQDVRLAPDGSTFLVADMLRNGVWLLSSADRSIIRFLPTGLGAHGVYPSRDAASIYVSNRDEGSVSVVDAATLTVRTTWPIPGGGSPDMGGVNADGSQLWLSARRGAEVYVFDTATGEVTHRVGVGTAPHGLAVWPQPGRFSLGHTGNMR